MHQGHNIPWSTFEKHFTFVEERKPRKQPPFIGLLYKESPAAVKELQHFVRKLAATIKEFSETERKKYPAEVPPISPNDKVFSDALRDKYPEYLSERFQSLSSWIDYAKHLPNGDRDFRDAIMVLLFEKEMETLLMLAQHPQIKMARMLELRCAHYQSPRAEESALWAYLFFSTMEAVGQLFNGGYTMTAQYRSLIASIGMGVPFCGQHVAHKMLHPGINTHAAKFPACHLVHTHSEELQEYLKRLFEVIYTYDLLAREVGVNPQWERQTKDNIIIQGGLPKDTAIDEHNQAVLIALDA